MKAVILAGGKGTRIGKLFPDLPKPMIPICGKPLLEWTVDSLTAQGITDITLIVGYKADVIQSHFGGRVKYIVEEEPLGTGGALTLLPREETLVLFGDLYCDIDYKRFIAFHKEKQADITLFVHPNSHPDDSDIVVTDSNNCVVAWKSKIDKERGELRNLVNAGMYIFSDSALPTGKAKKCDLEHDLLISLLSDGKVYAYRSTEYVKDMGTPERLKSVENDIENGATSARSMRNKQKAIFVDRDGTINKENGFIVSPDQLSLIEGTAEAIRLLNSSHFLTICITNQPVVARGEVTFVQLDAIHARLDTLLASEGAYLDDLLFCPHHTDKGFDGEVADLKIDCDCRKPKPGLLFEAAKRYNIDLTHSYMIGDRTADIAAGKTAGCATIGVRTGTALADGKYEAMADMMYDDLLDAVKHLISDDEMQ